MPFETKAINQRWFSLKEAHSRSSLLRFSQNIIQSGLSTAMLNQLCFVPSFIVGVVVVWGPMAEAFTFLPLPTVFTDHSKEMVSFPLYVSHSIDPAVANRKKLNQDLQTEGLGALQSLQGPLKQDYDTLLATVQTRKVSPDKVHAAMARLEKQSYRERWTQSSDTAQRMAQELKGDWRPIFSSGTTITQARLGGRPLNYFPIKAVISIRPEVGKIQNGLYLGDFFLVRLNGTCKYDASKRRFHFSFHYMSFLNGLFEVHLKEGDDTAFALAVGVGGHIGLWNILLADEQMMMARGAAKAITLWKRIDGHEAVWW